MAVSNFFSSLKSQLYYTGTDLYNGWNQPRWLLMRHAARFDAVRSLVKRYTPPPTKAYSVDGASSPFCGPIQIDDAVDGLHEHGFYQGLNLSQEYVKEIIAFAESSPCYGNRKGHRRFLLNEKEAAEARFGEQFHVAGVGNTEVNCPAIQKLQCDPQLLAIAADYLGTDPIHQGNQLWWSFGQQKSDPEATRRSHHFHYDLDDFRFIKVFFYLTDVDSNSGPHMVVPGSHKKKPLSHKWLRRPRPDEDIVAIYGAGSIETLCGKAGFGFVEDGFTIHKAMPPATRDRLLLSISYATRDYGMHRDHMPKASP